MDENLHDVFDDDDVEKVASDLAKLTIDAQRDAVAKIYSESVPHLLKIAVATIKIIKASDNDLVRNDNKFLALCDGGIASIQSIIDSGEIIKQKKRVAADCMIEILARANHPDSLIVSKIYEDEKLAGLTVLGLIATTIQMHC